MELNEMKHGFKLVRKKRIEDIDSMLYEMKHLQSGATLCYLENDDTNKAFMAGFRTLPEDSTGVCHIIEHTLLCGSDKYQLKEPFVNLLKGSMSTFLNAMTASDWTVYPVASQNDKDFDNLMASYLDAVFAPLSIKDIKPFLQEGWHVELTNKEDLPSLKGVVYNEMKGAMSSVDRQLYQATAECLYKGSGYGVNSGGDPDVIPTLTYDYYKDFYKKHYHPENALLYLYGKMDLDEKLRYIDEEYLSKFTAMGYATTIEMPKAIINTTERREYPITEADSEENNTYMSLAFGLGEYANIRELTAFRILDEALCSSNDSPLKKVILDAGIGEDVSISIEDDCIKPNLGIYLEKSEESKKELFYTTCMNAFKEFVEKGIDKDLLLATINNSEFRQKEMDMGTMPKGVIFGINMMNCFDYNLPLEDALELNQHYAYLKEHLHEGYFESLIDKYILHSNHYVQVTLVPSRTLASRKEEEMHQKMVALKEKMSEKELEECIQTTNELIAYQSKKDTPEELKTLPSLELSDITYDVNSLVTKEVTKNEIKCLEHEFNTNQIGYLKMYFDLQSLTLEELPYASVLAGVFVELDTNKHKASELQNQIKTYLGNVDFSVMTDAINQKEYVAKMVVELSALDENVSYIPSIFNEIINETIFDKEKVKTNLIQMKNMTRNRIIQNGMALAMQDAGGEHACGAKLQTKLSGYNFYTFVSEGIENIDAFTNTLIQVAKKIFNKNHLIVSLSGSRECIDHLYECLDKMELDTTKQDMKLEVTLDKSVNKAIVIPSEVNYNAKAINLDELHTPYSGKLGVLAHIVRYDYLWSEIRVKGGAYGCTIDINERSGNISVGSFRDPNVKETYATYDHLASYLEEFNPTEEEFKQYIIGAVGAFDKPASNNVRIQRADRNYLLAVSDEHRKEIKKEMVQTKIEDIKQYASLMKHLVSGNACTIGNESKIKSIDLFEKVHTL